MGRGKSAHFDRWVLWVKHMGRRTRAVIREKTDYTRFLLDLQGQGLPSSPKPTPVVPSKPKISFSPYRQRIMSDETVKYLYSKSSGVFHDKSCPEALKIPDEELCCSKEYLTEIPQCPLCAIKAYVRLGAKDLYNFHRYERLFDRMRFDPALIRQMYIQKGLKTFAGSNGLTIWGKEDSWRLEFREDSDKTRLMHNNYHPLPDGTRVFTKGYHVQVDPVTPQYALSVIAEYTYEAHKAAMLRREQEVQERLRRLSAAQMPAPSEMLPTEQRKTHKTWAKVTLFIEKFKTWLREVFLK